MNAQQKDRALYDAIIRNLGSGNSVPEAMAKNRQRAGIYIDHARTLRRAQMTLHRWAEEMCNGTIQRDDDSVTICTQCGHKEYGDKAATAGTPCVKCGDPAPLRKMATRKPFRHYDAYPAHWYNVHTLPKKQPVPDRERGALARVEAVCRATGLYYYHQTDPRGCALYVSTEPLNDQNYSSRGIPCAL